MKPKILAVIPARGGSKGIPRKNIKMLAGNPLISYSIKNALQSKYIHKVVVSTDDDEILYVSKLCGADVIDRPKELAGDSITLDPVIYHALNYVENLENEKYDFVITLQPTSPLLKVETIDKAIKLILKENLDTLISVKADFHLCWTIENEHFTPLYEERKNRQYLDPIYRETGSFLISKRGLISKHNRIGEKLSLFKVPSEESIDIDTYDDWMIAENSLERKKIVFRVDGGSEIGLGHVYRAITLASRLAFKNEVLFLMDKNKKAGVEKVSSFNFTVVTFNDDNDMFKKLEQINPNIIINDILDTNTEYMFKLKSMGHFVVNFEDLGEGSEQANIVINSLYEHSYPPENHYFGHKYVCLRDEFYLVPPKKVSESVKNIMITFGGTDPSNLTLRTLKSIKSLNLKDVDLTVIMGLGYAAKEELYAYINQLLEEGFHINVKENINMMAKEISNADIVLTSNGRTIYEITSIGTPFISISQNERESRHLFVHYLKGNMYLGMEYAVSEADIASAIKELVENYDLRKKINENLLKADLKGGMDRILRLILDIYKERDKNENTNF
jgi:CMP-N-acetylneuraminic acid synthetase